MKNKKTKVVMSKPIHVGCASLDLPKLTMLQFHYNVIEQPVQHKYIVPYCDTDSFVYNIKHPDSYEWIKENNQHFDLSCYKREDRHDNENTKKTRTFKK